MKRFILMIVLGFICEISFAQTIASNKIFKVDEKLISVSGKKIELNADGFPKQITNDDFAGRLLYEAMHFHLYTSPKAQVKFVVNDFNFVNETADSIVWIANSSSANLEMIVRANLSSNGSVVYKVKLKALNAITLTAINFHIPFEKTVSKYLTGLGEKNYLRPDTVKWQQSNWLKVKPAVWIGNEQLGLYFSVKETSDWLIRNGGAMQINVKGSSMLTDVYTGSVALEKNDELNFDFNFILTPQSSVKSKLNFGRQFKLYEKLDKQLAKNK